MGREWAEKMQQHSKKAFLALLKKDNGTEKKNVSQRKEPRATENNRLMSPSQEIAYRP